MPKKSPKKSPSEIPSFPGLEPWPTASQAMVLENVGRTCFYGRLIRGEYEAYKDGPITRINPASILRRRQNLPKATFKSPGTARTKSPRLSSLENL